jgi:hypothetical protein
MNLGRTYAQSEASYAQSEASYAQSEASYAQSEASYAQLEASYAFSYSGLPLCASATDCEKVMPREASILG